MSTQNAIASNKISRVFVQQTTYTPKTSFNKNKSHQLFRFFLALVVVVVVFFFVFIVCALIFRLKCSKRCGWNINRDMVHRISKKQIKFTTQHTHRGPQSFEFCSCDNSFHLLGCYWVASLQSEHIFCGFEILFISILFWK